MPFDIWNLVLPEFDWFTRKPRAAECKVVDTQRIIAEILWGKTDAREESQKSDFSHENIIAGQYAVVLKYRREKDNKTYPAISMSYDLDDEWNVIIRQIQRAQNKKVSFRFHSSFDSNKYFMKLIQENFTDKWIKVFMPIAEWMDWVWFRSTAIQEMEDIQKKLNNLNASIPN